jgi:hypothetical protein
MEQSAKCEYELIGLAIKMIPFEKETGQSQVAMACIESSRAAVLALLSKQHNSQPAS